MILSFGPEAASLSPAVLALWLPSIVALACYVAAATPGERFTTGLRRALLIGWIAQGLSILVDVAGVGSGIAGVRFGFAPALSITLWLVLAVYELESRFVPLPGARRALASCAAVVVVLAWLFPGQLHPQAVSVWAPLHWLLGIASYGLFGVAVLHALLLSRAERQMRRTALAAAPVAGLPILRLERLTFRFVGAGFIVLSAAIVLGAWFADPWRWDHKTLFSILGWIVFAGLLAGRRAFGWRGPKAARWLYAGAAMLLLGYVGSRFVLEVLLHRAPPIS
ncbi:MAG: cytochrome c biogenesis protein CcsA [Pseudomonadota bacterium]|nr:cytochrome c biogenesis protein CcsA [Pseudomonadota bacterium]